MMRQLEGNAMNKLSERYIKNRQKQFKKMHFIDQLDQLVRIRRTSKYLVIVS